MASFLVLAMAILYVLMMSKKDHANNKCGHSMWVCPGTYGMTATVSIVWGIFKYFI